MIVRSPPDPGHWRTFRPAFSLVELLAAIGIVLILIGILLPALRGARTDAFRKACLSQVRQMAIAVTVYASDSQDSVPFPFLRAASPGPTGWTTPDGRPVPPEAPLAAGDFWVHPMLDAYGGSFIAPALLCPLDTRTLSTAEWAAVELGTTPERVWVPLARPISRAFYTRPGSLARDRPAMLAPQDARVARVFEVMHPSSKALVLEEAPFHPARAGLEPDQNLQNARLTIAATDGSASVRAVKDAIPPALVGVQVPPNLSAQEQARFESAQRAATAFHHTRDGVRGRDW